MLNRDFYGSYLEKSYLDGDKKYYRFVISSNHVDRSGDSINVYGINTQEYERNPIVLYNHDPSIVIGTSKIVKEDNYLYGDVWFDEVHEISKKTKQQIDLGTLKTASIGLEVYEVGQRELSEQEKAQNLRNWIKKVRTIDKSNMFEWSIVPLPANIEAERKRLEIKKEFEMNEVIEKAGAKISKKNLTHLQNAISEINSVISDMEVDEKQAELDATIEKLQSEIDELTKQNQTLQNENSELQKKLQPAKINLNEFLNNYGVTK